MQLHAFAILNTQKSSCMRKSFISNLGLLVHEKMAAITAVDATFSLPRHLNDRSEATYAVDWQSVPMPVTEWRSRLVAFLQDL